jgi:hypothetical protein
MYITIEGIYCDGKVTLLETPPFTESKVLVTFMENLTEAEIKALIGASKNKKE